MSDKALCSLARTSINMMTYQGTDPTSKEFLQLPNKTLQIFYALVNSGAIVTEDKCKLSEKDTDPLNLKQLTQEIFKKLSKGVPQQNKVAAPKGAPKNAL